MTHLLHLLKYDFEQWSWGQALPYDWLTSPLIWGVMLYCDQSVERTIAVRWAPAEWPHRYRPLSDRSERVHKTQTETWGIYDWDGDHLGGNNNRVKSTGTWCENTAQQQTRHSCVLERPSDPCYLKSMWKTTGLTLLVHFPVCSSFPKNRNNFQMKRLYLWGQCHNRQQPPLHLYQQEEQPWIQTPPCCVSTKHQH